MTAGVADNLTDRSSRWPHRLALLTVLAALPLLFLGAEVTTKKVGMADPVWPTEPLYLFGISWADSSIGFLIEHSHRLAGYTVGVCTILLMAILWWKESRRWVCWLGVAALLAVSAQGVLGGFRVRLNAMMGPELALVHGVFGQLVFALLCSVAIFTSRRWTGAGETMAVSEEEAASLRRWSLALPMLVVLQLILGAMVRHKEMPLAQRGHLLWAFVVVGVAVWLAKSVWEAQTRNRRLSGGAGVILVLLAVQVALGVESWLTRFAGRPLTNPDHWLFNQDLVRSLHAVTGSIILAFSVALALEAYRATAALGTRSVPASIEQLEGAL